MIEQCLDILPDNLKWIELLAQFFDLDRMIFREKKSALRIEKFFQNMKRNNVKLSF